MLTIAKWFSGNEAAARTWSLSAAGSSVVSFTLFGLILLVGFGAFAFTHSFLILAMIVAAGCVLISWRIGVKSSLGVFLLLMPMQYLAIALLQFSGVSQYEAISAIKELILIAGTLWLLRSTRLYLTAPDVVLGAVLIVVCCEQLFHIDPRGLRNDWEWAFVYVFGRVLVLQPSTQALWAKCAVWMCAVLSIVGIWEVAILGPLPRTLLLRATVGEMKLPDSFLATGYTGFRAASTMVSPLTFSGLCMVALVLWWTYMKNPIPAILIGAGLVFTLTRSSVLGAVLGIGVVAVRRWETKRIAFYALIALMGFAVAVPTLDLSKFLNASFTSGADTSTLGHEQSVVKGFNTMLDNPLGTGAGTVGPRISATNVNAPHVIESSFLAIAIEYGMIAGALYVAFFVCCLWCLFKLNEPLGYAAFSILLGYSLLDAVGPLHLDIPLATWVWVPVGMGITRAAATSRIPYLRSA